MNTNNLGRKAVALLLMVAAMTGAFAANSIPGVGTVVKKKPGNGPITVPPTDHNGRFTLKLSAGEYSFAVNHADVGPAIAQIIKQQNFKTPYDGTGLEMTFDKSPNVLIKQGQTTRDGAYKLDKSSAEIVIIITGKEATLSGQLNWNEGGCAKEPRLCEKVGSGASTSPAPQVLCTAPTATTSVVNGACGTGWQQPASVATAAQMAAMHCATGTLTSFIGTTNPITWSCAGSGGGTSMTCSKPGGG